MSLSLGLVGLPNSGKSTLFNAMTNAGAVVASYPFTTIEPNVGVVPVPDQRLHDIAQIVKPDKEIPTTVEFVDIAGLVEGASRGEGLGNQFLGHIRNVDAIVMVLRAFTDQDVAHVYGTIDPVRDVQTLGIELALADIGTLEKRIDRIRQAARSGDKVALKELSVLEKAHEQLEKGIPVRQMGLDSADLALLHDLNLLTSKPVLYALNVDEEDLAALESGSEQKNEAAAWAAGLERLAQTEKAQVAKVSAKIECELVDLEPEEAQEYLDTLGVKEAGLTKLIHAGYRLLNLVTFFTTTGGKEVRAWTVVAGTKTPEAAGKIHTDMEKGFIRAEVISYDDLMRAGSFQEAHNLGLQRVEGRDYVIQDGDIVHIRFNVGAK
jgi:GTP-binding protein YchF